MKIFKKAVMMVAMVAGTTAHAQSIEEANYFRVWQGFKKPSLTDAQFMTGVASFMKDTVDLYREKALNNYIVIVPPANKPDFIPDELALVALNSEANYRAIRATPEGQAYADKHWDVFDRSTSKSASMVNLQLNPQVVLENNVAYDVVGRPINWSVGFNAVYIGLRNEGVTSAEFLQKLLVHVQQVKSVMKSKGLLGYIIVANDNYEIAYMNWATKDDHDKAWGTDDAKVVQAEARAILTPLMYQQAIPFVAGSAIAPVGAYSTLQK